MAGISRTRAARVAAVALATLVGATSAIVLVSNPSGATSPRLAVTAPRHATVGEPIELDLTLLDAVDVAGYEIAVTAPDTGATVGSAATTSSIDHPRVGGVDLSVDGMGDRAVLARLRCANGCGSDTEASGDLRLGSVTVTPIAAGALTIEVPGAIVVDEDGASVAVADATQSIEITVDGDADRDTPFAPAPSATDATAPPSADDAVLATELPDLSRDGTVDGRDIDELATLYRLNRANADAQPGCTGAGDLNGNGCVDVGDLVVAPRLVDDPAFAGFRSTAAAPSAPAPIGPGDTIVVDTTQDVWDPQPGNGKCAIQGGKCTLRAAIQEANAAPGHQTIAFDIPGNGVRTIQLMSQMVTINDSSGGVTIDGFTQPGSSVNTDPLADNAVRRIAIRGNGASSFDGFTIVSADNVIRGLSIYNTRRGVWIWKPTAMRNRLVGNIIGSDPDATFVAPSFQGLAYGVHVEQDAPDTVVGTPALADRNVISGNGNHGVGFWHNNTDRNVVQNNIVGLSPDGTRSVPNRRHGIDFNFGVSQSVIGGTGPREHNVVSGNDGTAIELSHTALTTGNVVAGNLLGTDLTGNTAPAFAANLDTGIYVEDGVTDTLIHDNVVVNSVRGGVTITNGGSNGTTRNTVFRDNRVGVTLAGTPAPNGAFGMLVNASDTVVQDNVIVHNNGQGIRSLELNASGNRFSGNEIHDNAGLAIDLAPLNVHNVNDADDADSGPNGLLNHPVWTAATTELVEGTACAGCTVEIFSGDGPSIALASLATVVADGSGHFATTVAAPAGSSIVATATDAGNNTSELSAAIVVEAFDAAPTLTLDPTPEIPEGGDGVLTASAVDPEGTDPLIEWDLDDDGTFEASGPSVPLSAAGLDGPTTIPIRVRATDGAGSTDETTADVAVVNANPTMTLVVSSLTDEGDAVDVSFTEAADASADDQSTLRYALGCDGASLDGVTYEAATALTSLTCDVDDGPASPTITARVLDDDGGFTEYVTTADVANVAPEITITGAPQQVNEGTIYAVGSDVTDPSTADTDAGITVDWTGGSNPGSGPIHSVVTTDNGTIVLTATATDKDGGVGTAQATTIVKNVAPSGTFDTETTTDEGVISELRIEGATDPSSADLAAGLRFAFSCDGSSLAAVTYATASTEPTATCVYDDGLASHFVRAAVLDKDGGRSDYSTTASAGANQPPTVDVPTSSSVQEGATVSLSATATDPEGGEVVVEWDLDGDGTFETPGTDVVFDAADLDGPTSRVVTVRATDTADLSSQAESTVNVLNVAPTATLPTAATAEAQPVTISLTDLVDVPADLATLRFAFSCTGASLASVQYADAGTDPSVTCTYANGPTTPTVRARVFDDDGGVTERTATVTVANLAPVVTADPAPTGKTEGQSVSLAYNVTDVPADQPTLLSSWTVRRNGALVASGNSSPVSFSAGDDGDHVVTIVGTDRDGASTTLVRTVAVAGVAPTATMTAPATAAEGKPVDITFSNAVDPSPVDVADGLRYAVSCDGSSLAGTTWATASTNPVRQCTFPDGPAAVTVRGRIYDADGLYTESTAVVDVTNVAPTARFVVPRDIDEGEKYTISIDQLADKGTDTLTTTLACSEGGTTTTASSLVCPPTTGPLHTVVATVTDDDGATTTYPAVIVVHKNPVPNPGFETDANGDGFADQWIGSSRFVVDPAAAHNGTRGVKVTSTESASAALWNDVNVSERRPYRGRAFVKIGQTGTASVQVRLRWYTAGGTLLATIPSATLTTTGGQWVELGRDYTAPTGATKARIEFAVTTANGGSVMIDDAAIVYTSDLLNGDLETAASDGKPHHWFQTSRFVTTTAPVLGGATAGRAIGDGTTFGPGQRVYNVQAGKQYHLTFWINSLDTDFYAVQPRVRWLDSTNSTLSLEVMPSTYSPTPGWVQISGSFTAPAGVGDTLIELMHYYLVGDAYIDQVYFGEA